jgi:hypothetical protein
MIRVRRYCGTLRQQFESVPYPLSDAVSGISQQVRKR